MLYGMDKKTAGHVARQFESRTVDKLYQSVVVGLDRDAIARCGDVNKCLGRVLDVGNLLEVYRREGRRRGKKKRKAGKRGEEYEETAGVPDWCRKENVGVFKDDEGGGVYISCPVRENEEGGCDYWCKTVGTEGGGLEMESWGEDEIVRKWELGRGGKTGWKLAVTKAEFEREIGGGWGLVLRPVTGRRHQLRLHMLSLGGGIKGDATYGFGEEDNPRMYLNAYEITVKDFDGITERRWNGRDMFEEEGLKDEVRDGESRGKNVEVKEGDAA